MIKKHNKDEVSIDIFASRTQSGKTTSIINRMKQKSHECFNICVPNYTVAADLFCARIKRDLKHAVDIIVYKDSKSISVAALNDRLISNHVQQIQSVVIFMGNIYQLKASNVFAAQHAVQKQFASWKVGLHIDESDLYIVGHDPKNWVGKDLLMQYVVDSKTPEWECISFYTATIYAHALQVFSHESLLSQYNIRWNTTVLENLRRLPYWGYEGIETERHDSLLKVYTQKTGHFDPLPLIPIMDQLQMRDSIMFVHHRNDCHDALLHWVQSEYDSAEHPVYCIIVNQHGIRCTSRRGSAATREFSTIDEAADWALSEGAYKLVWIGDQALTRMQTLRDSKNQLPLSKMVLLTEKDIAETIIQLTGRLTAVLDVERYNRVLYASSKMIKLFESCRTVDLYFEQCLLKNGTITLEDFQAMPAHPGLSLTSKRKSNGVQKSTKAISYEEHFDTLEDAFHEFGKRNVFPIQSLISEEEYDHIMATTSLMGGQKRAGKNLEHYEELLQGDPSKEMHKRETVFVTPKGKYIDNRKCQSLLANAKRQNINHVATFDSKGRCLVWDTEKLGKQLTSYIK